MNAGIAIGSEFAIISKFVEPLLNTKFGQSVLSKGPEYLSNITSKISEQNKFFAKKVTSGLGNMINKFTDSKIVKALKEIEKYLGKNPKFINNNGNITIMSKDGKRQVRFDFNQRDDKPHFHLKNLKNNGKFGDAIKSIHRFYFKELN